MNGRSLVLLVVVLMSVPLAAQAVTLSPTRVGFAQDTDFNGVGDFGVTGAVRVSPNQRGIILFDVSGLTGPVSSAMLSFLRSDASWSQSRELGVYGGGGDFDITASDYTLGSAITSFNYNSEAFVAFLDLTTFLNSFLSNPFACSGIQLNGGTCYAQIQIAWPPTGGISSPDYVIFGNAQLQVTERAAVPEPGTLALLGLGLMGLGLTRRKAA